MIVLLENSIHIFKVEGIKCTSVAWLTENYWLPLAHENKKSFSRRKVAGLCPPVGYTRAVADGVSLGSKADM